METDTLKTVGQVAGVGGIALVVFLRLFREVIRKSIFPTLKKDDGYRLLRLITVLVTVVALAGLGTWAWVQTARGPGQHDGTQVTATNGGVAAGGSITSSRITTIAPLPGTAADAAKPSE